MNTPYVKQFDKDGIEIPLTQSYINKSPNRAMRRSGITVGRKNNRKTTAARHTQVNIEVQRNKKGKPILDKDKNTIPLSPLRHKLIKHTKRYLKAIAV